MIARKGAAALEAEAADLGLGQVLRQLEGPGAGLRRTCTVSSTVGTQP